MIRSSWSSTITFLKSLEGSLLKGSFRSCAGAISPNRDGQRCILHINGLPLLNRIEEVELSGVALVVEVDRIVTAEAGVAKSLGPAVEKAVHALMTEITETVRVDELADLFHRTSGGDEF